MSRRAIRTMEWEARTHVPPDHCPDPECHVCSVRACPHKEPLHFHHDGCPACFYDPIQDPAHQSPLRRPYSSRYHAGFEAPSPDHIRAVAFNYPWRRANERPPNGRPDKYGRDHSYEWECYWAEQELDTAIAATHYAWPMEDVDMLEVYGALVAIQRHHDRLAPPRGWDGDECEVCGLSATCCLRGAGDDTYRCDDCCGHGCDVGCFSL